MIKRKDSKGEEEVKNIKQHGRKAYAPPKLTEYGSVEKLTQGSTGPRRDAGTPTQP